MVPGYIIYVRTVADLQSYGRVYRMVIRENGYKKLYSHQAHSRSDLWVKVSYISASSWPSCHVTRTKAKTVQNALQEEKEVFCFPFVRRLLNRERQRTIDVSIRYIYRERERAICFIAPPLVEMTKRQKKKNNCVFDYSNNIYLHIYYNVYNGTEIIVYV